MQTPELDPRPSAPRPCSRPECERPRVLLADVCRSHLVDTFKAEGDDQWFGNPDFDELAAVGRWFLRIALDGLPEELRTSLGATWPMDLYAMMEPEGDWKLVQLTLDILTATIVDTPPFSGTRLEVPLDYQGKILLRLQVGVPRDGLEQFGPRLKLLMESMVRELSGPQALVGASAFPAENVGTDD